MLLQYHCYHRDDAAEPAAEVGPEPSPEGGASVRPDIGPDCGRVVGANFEPAIGPVCLGHRPHVYMPPAHTCCQRALLCHAQAQGFRCHVPMLHRGVPDAMDDVFSGGRTGGVRGAAGGGWRRGGRPPSAGHARRAAACARAGAAPCRAAGCRRRGGTGGGRNNPTMLPLAAVPRLRLPLHTAEHMPCQQLN
jgi:hypothetical protein